MTGILSNDGSIDIKKVPAIYLCSMLPSAR